MRMPLRVGIGLTGLALRGLARCCCTLELFHLRLLRLLHFSTLFYPWPPFLSLAGAHVSHVAQLMLGACTHACVLFAYKLTLLKVVLVSLLCSRPLSGSRTGPKTLTQALIPCVGNSARWRRCARRSCGLNP